VGGELERVRGTSFGRPAQAEDLVGGSMCSRLTSPTASREELVSFRGDVMDKADVLAGKGAE
jgi:hypothetical protein